MDVIDIQTFRHEKTCGRADTVRGNFGGLRKFSAGGTSFYLNRPLESSNIVIVDLKNSILSVKYILKANNRNIQLKIMHCCGKS